MLTYRRSVRLLLIGASAIATVLSIANPPSAQAVVMSSATPVLGQKCDSAAANGAVDMLTLTVTTQCVADQYRRTRGRLKEQCIFNPADPTKALIPDQVYMQTECKNNTFAESIAHARAVAQLNNSGVYGSKGIGGITPNLQWETVIPSGRSQGPRPDLLLYDRTNLSGTIGLAEVKVDQAGGGEGAAAASRQLTGYLAAFASTVVGRKVEAYDFTARPFIDSFYMTQPCKGQRGQEQTNHYITTSASGFDGVLVVNTTLGKCKDKDEQETTTKNGLVVTIGQDADHNGRDDSLDTLSSNPQYRQSTTPIPSLFQPLPTPLKVRLDLTSLHAIETAALQGGSSAWAALVARLASAQVTTSTLVGDATALLAAHGILAARAGTVTAEAEAILAADTALSAAAAAEGLTTLAVVEAVVDVTLGLAAIGPILVVAAVAAVVLAAVWAGRHWHVFGDPHLATLDGLGYNLQSVGEFHVVKVPGTDIDVQARFVPYNANVSRMTGVAFGLNGNGIEIRNDGTILVNGVAQSSSQVWFDFGRGASLMRNGNQVLVVFPGDEATTLAVSISSFAFNIGFSIPAGTKTIGLLGNNDGIPGNDLVTASGEQVTGASAGVIYGTYADSWRITDAESWFTYGVDQDTDSFTDESFPAQVTTLGDFPDDVVNAAADVCRSKNVQEGPQFEDCELDVAVTGDASYATAAAAVTTFLQDPTAHSVNTAGTLSETFEGTIPVNLAPTSTVTVPGGKGAGPVFDNSGYRFSVPSLPSHSSATVAFDLYAFGLRASGAPSGTVTVNVDGLPAVGLALTPSGGTVSSGTATLKDLGSGTATPGGAYRKYRVTISGEHLTDQLRVSLNSTGFRGVLNTSLAIDNVAVSLQLVPAQTFAITPTASISDGVPTSGAGRLENKASHDIYTFTIPATGAVGVYVRPGTCPSGLVWEITNSAKAVAARGDCHESEVRNLVPGTYTLNIHAASDVAVPATYTAALTMLTPDLNSGSFTIGGAAKTITTTTIGQNATATFAGTAAHRIQLQTTSTSFPQGAYWSVLKPDGTTLISSYGNHLIDTTTLPVGGTYTVKVDPVGTGTGSITVKVWDVPADANAGSLTMGGAAKTITTTAAGQNATATFNGTAAHRIQLQTSGTSFPQGAYWSVLKPDGTTLISSSGNQLIDTTTLPATGTYTVRVDPIGTGIGSIAVKVWDVPADVNAGSFTIGGATKTIMTTAAGQNATATFTGTAAHRIQLQTSGTSFPQGAYWSVLKPDGTTLVSSSGDRFVDTTTLPATGTYTLRVDPIGIGTGSITVKVWDVPADVNAGSFTIGGTAKTITTAAAGQNATATFTGTATHRIQLQTSGTTFAQGTYWSIVKPDGTTLISSSGNQLIDTTTLPATGTYTVRVDPIGTGTGSIVVKVWDVPADVNAGSFTIGGAAKTITTTAAGQNATATFTGTTAHRIQVQTSGISFPQGAYWSVLKPDGTTLISSSGNQSVGATLPATGTYTVRVDPIGTGTGSITVLLSAVPNTVTVTNPGPQAAVATKSFRVQVVATDSDPAEVLIYSATGLPSGVSINRTSGLISGNPGSAGSFTATVTVTDSTNVVATASFTITVSGTNSACTAVQLLGNPGFESGTAPPWTVVGNVIKASVSGSAHAGGYLALLDGTGYAHTDTLSQTVSIPAACTASTLSFWLYVRSNELTPTFAFDKLTVKIGADTLATYSNLDKVNNGYLLKTLPLTSYAGQTVTITFSGTEDSSGPTSFFIDDTAIITS